jgi:citrate lyase subunit beta/citryl-CoA lyase
MRPITSALFVPGTRADRFDKAVASGADAVILDLEDAVVLEDKAKARQLVEEWLVHRPLVAPRAVVRINTQREEDLASDLDLVSRLAPSGLGFVMVPKTESFALLSKVAEAVPPSVRLIAIVESAKGVYGLPGFSKHERLHALAFGAADYSADVGCSLSERALLYARSAVAVASAAAGLHPPLDSPCFDTEDGEVIRRHAEHGRELGFGGSLCVHPAQIPHIAAGYAPTPTEVSWATRVLEADPAGGAVRVGSEMVDAPVRQRAARIIALSGAGPTRFEERTS